MMANQRRDRREAVPRRSVFSVARARCDNITSAQQGELLQPFAALINIATPVGHK
jgi:hypothetical protein